MPKTESEILREQTEKAAARERKAQEKAAKKAAQLENDELPLWLSAIVAVGTVAAFILGFYAVPWAIHSLWNGFIFMVTNGWEDAL